MAGVLTTTCLKSSRRMVVFDYFLAKIYGHLKVANMTKIPTIILMKFSLWNS